MKYTILLSALVLAGCNDLGGLGRNAAPVDADNTAPVDVDNATERDNTGVNVRDRSDAVKTPLDQNENQRDIGITAEIRDRVVDTEMSINAQNVKIITQDGIVTLRGPVASAEEKSQIEKLAQEVAGSDNVVSQLEVQP